MIAGVPNAMCYHLRRLLSVLWPVVAFTTANIVGIIATHHGAEAKDDNYGVKFNDITIRQVS